MMQLETEKETKDCDNLDKLRELVDQLEMHPFGSTPYSQSLQEIQKVISEEMKIIDNLKKNDSKVKHYEIICRNVLSIIASVNP